MSCACKRLHGKGAKQEFSEEAIHYTETEMLREWWARMGNGYGQRNAGGGGGVVVDFAIRYHEV